MTESTYTIFDANDSSNTIENAMGAIETSLSNNLDVIKFFDITSEGEGTSKVVYMTPKAINLSGLAIRIEMVESSPIFYLYFKVYNVETATSLETSMSLIINSSDGLSSVYMKTHSMTDSLSIDFLGNIYSKANKTLTYFITPCVTLNDTITNPMILISSIDTNPYLKFFESKNQNKEYSTASTSYGSGGKILLQNIKCFSNQFDDWYFMKRIYRIDGASGISTRFSVAGKQFLGDNTTMLAFNIDD